MYESFFKLRRKPFDLTPNPEFLYMSKIHQRAINYLLYGIRENAGFILLTGDIGSGKTTLIRGLINHLKDQAIIAKVLNTQINSAQLLGLINMDFGLNVTTLDKTVLLRDLNDFLIECYARNVRPLLIIDEAQNLSLDALEEVRLLSNLETDSEKLLQIIMVGQPELQSILLRDEMIQLRQRISVSCHLGSIPADEIREYFLHRLACAGNRHAVNMSEDSFSSIHRACSGVPRLINILGDYLLLTAYYESLTDLPDDFVRDVVDDVRLTIAFSEHPSVGMSSSSHGSATGGRAAADRFPDETGSRSKEIDAFLRDIIRKHVVQIDRLEDQLEAISASIHAIELELKKKAGKDGRASEPGKSNLRSV